MLEFILGIATYYLVKGLYALQCKKTLPRLLLPVSLIAFIGIFLVLMITKARINILGFGRFFLWGIPAIVLVLCAFLIGLFLKMPKFSVTLGNMSYSLYLVHYYPVMLLDRMVFDFSTCTTVSLFGVAISFVICLVAAYVVWILVEKKLTGWLKKRFL